MKISYKLHDDIPLVDFHLIFEIPSFLKKLSLMNFIFGLVWTWFLQATQIVKNKFEPDKKSSSLNSFFQTRDFKNQVQIDSMIRN